MRDFIDGLLKVIRAAFGIGTSQVTEAWVDRSAMLTPREAMIQRVNNIFQFGALAHAAVLIALLIVVLVARDITQSVGLLLLSQAAVAGDVALMAALAVTAANMGTLLLLAAGAQAQEAWAVPVALGAAIINGLLLVSVGFLPGALVIITVIIAGYFAARDIRAFHGNPVTIKELRGRMRGVRSFAIITIFLVLMGSFTVILYLLQLPAVTGGATVITGELGRILFMGVVGVELMLIIFIVPALTAGAVTGERERQTYDLLQTTLLSAPSFLVGKMESALGYILLLLLSAIPLQSIAFLFGGVSETEVIIAFIILMATGLVLGAAGLFFSAQTDRTLTATVRVYSAAMIMTFAVPIVGSFLFQGAFSSAISGVAATQTSTSAGETALIYGDMIVSSLNPITAALFTQQILIDHQELFIVNIQLASDGTTIPVLSPWVLLTIIYVTTTALLILMGIRRMRRGD